MSYSGRPCLLPPPDNIEFSGCLSFGSKSKKTNEIYNKIFMEDYSELALKEYKSDPELRVNVMMNIIASFNCPIHHKMIIKDNIGLAIWMIGEYSLSISEILDGLSILKRSIGNIPFPNCPPNDDEDHHWFEECRRRLLIMKEGNVKLRIQIAVAFAKLLNKLKICDGLSRERLKRERLESIRFIASIWLLPKPVGLGSSTIEFYNVEMKRCITKSLPLCDTELKMVLKKGTVENLISLLSKKLEEDEPRYLCDKALDQFEAIFLGSNNISGVTSDDDFALSMIP